MSRRVVLVSLDWIRGKDPMVSMGHASLLARLFTVPGVDTVPVTRAVNAPSFDMDELLQSILREAQAGTTDVAIGAYVWNEPVLRVLLPMLRTAGFQGRILLGGPQISFAAAGVGQQYPEADGFIRGYAEDALSAIVTSGEPIRLAGVSWKNQDEDPCLSCVDLESLPSPILSGVAPTHPFMRWETQRGCAYACSFCQHGEPSRRRRARTFPLARVLAEIDVMVHSGVRDIAVLDPIFQDNPSAVDILDRFRECRYTGRLSLQSRFERVDSRFLDACKDLQVCLEFGLQTIQPQEMGAIGRRNDLGRADSVIAELRRRGIPFEVSVIYGLPTQTLDSFRGTLSWCQVRGVPRVRAFPLMLLRGTALDRDREMWHLVENQDVIPLVVQSDTFNHSDWLAMRALSHELDTAALGRVA